MKIMRESRKSIALSFVLAVISLQVFAQSFGRKEFYTVMASGNVKMIDAQMDVLKNYDGKDKPAFEGALMMKKAGIINGAGKKLNLFKAGHKKLEAAIQKEDDNAEYRFLRLMIQEHAPGILGYKDDLKKDSAYIRQSYKKLPAEVQEAITNYSKTSKILKSED